MYEKSRKNRNTKKNYLKYILKNKYVNIAYKILHFQKSLKYIFFKQYQIMRKFGTQTSADINIVISHPPMH